MSSNIALQTENWLFLDTFHECDPIQDSIDNAKIIPTPSLSVLRNKRFNSYSYYMTNGKTIALTIGTFVGKVMSLFFLNFILFLNFT